MKTIINILSVTVILLQALSGSDVLSPLAKDIAILALGTINLVVPFLQKWFPESKVVRVLAK